MLHRLCCLLWFCCTAAAVFASKSPSGGHEHTDRNSRFHDEFQNAKAAAGNSLGGETFVPATPAPLLHLDVEEQGAEAAVYAIVGITAAIVLLLVVGLALVYCKLAPGSQHSGACNRGDVKLARNAQKQYYQQQKQKIVTEKRKYGTDTESEGTDPNIYECHGLASTNGLDVKNPVFHKLPATE